jgi:uncharacterized protein
MKFEWDGAEEQANLKKHGLNFDLASKVFFDPYVIDIEDCGIEDELRFNAIGMANGRLLVVTYTKRGAVIRIISARGAEPYEKRKYHEG